MIIQRMHHEVKLRGNKIDSNHFKDLPTAFIDDFLNDAQFEFKEICYSGRNDKRYKLGFEMSQQRIDLLSPLVVSDEPLTPVLLGDGIYQIDLNTLNQTYDHFLRGHIITDCGRISITIDTNNELDVILFDTNRKPSAIWKRCIGIFAGNNLLHLYTNNEFTIDEVFVTYLKKPRNVFFGGYDTLEYLEGDLTAPSNVTPPINSEFTDGTATSTIIDLTIQLIARSLKDPNTLQVIEDKISRIL